MAKGRGRGRTVRSLKGAHGGGTTFSRNSSVAPSTGNTIGSYKLTNPAAAKAYGARGKLGNPSGSMVQTGRFGGGR